MPVRPACAPTRAPRTCLALLLATIAAPNLARAGDGIAWREDYERTLAEARQAGRPVWLQFTGPWCVYCRLMERNTFPRPEVVAASRDGYIPVKVRSDAREDLVAAYQIGGLPATVLLAPDGRELARREGYIEAPDLCDLLAAYRPAPAPISHSTDAELALAGYSPVSLVRGVGLTPGQPDLTVTHDGQVFRFASADERDAFLKEPDPFLPANGGFCPVRLADEDRKVKGDPRFGVHYRGRMYLCADEEARRRFADDPKRYCDVDLADQGHCPHCRSLLGRLVRGKPQYAANHSGRRYLFPDRTHLEAFRAAPDRFIR